MNTNTLASQVLDFYVVSLDFEIPSSRENFYKNGFLVLEMTTSLKCIACVNNCKLQIIQKHTVH